MKCFKTPPWITRLFGFIYQGEIHRKHLHFHICYICYTPVIWFRRKSFWTNNISGTFVKSEGEQIRHAPHFNFDRTQIRRRFFPDCRSAFVRLKIKKSGKNQYTLKYCVYCTYVVRLQTLLPLPVYKLRLKLMIETGFQTLWVCGIYTADRCPSF